MEKIFKYSPEEKLAWFGEGEWVNEPDEVLFTHYDYKCQILRVVRKEMSGSPFGGHLCGYVCIPPDHPWHGKRLGEIDCECHGGLTFSQPMKSSGWWIGFDCAHSNDVVPSIELLCLSDADLMKIKKNRHDLRKQLSYLITGESAPLFTMTYRNIQFCVDQCQMICEIISKIKE